MIPDKLIYTDGRDVTVTDSTLKVKNASYKINGITKLCMWTIRPDRWPGILLLLIGAAFAVCGFLNLIPSEMNLQIDGRSLNMNMIALWAGAGLAILGILILAMVREKYAVRIGTAEGEKNAIISHKREYIAQIVDALNTAFHFDHPSTYYSTKREAMP